MRYGRYGLSYLFLRLGLGLTFLWIGVDMFRHPDIWIGYIPAEPGFGLSRETALSMAGAFDTALGLLLLLRIWSKLAGILVVAHMVGVLVMQGVDAVLIRDVGLLGAGLALAFWPARYRRRKLWRWGSSLFSWRGGKDEED